MSATPIRPIRAESGVRVTFRPAFASSRKNQLSPGPNFEPICGIDVALEEGRPSVDCGGLIGGVDVLAVEDLALLVKEVGAKRCHIERQNMLLHNQLPK